MKPGLYVLDHQVKNPKLDRRMKNNWVGRTDFPIGTYQVSAPGHVDVIEIIYINGQFSSINNVMNPEMFEALSKNLRPKPENEFTLADILISKYKGVITATDILIHLLNQGVVTLEQAEAAAGAINALTDEEQLANRRKQGYSFSL